MSSWTSDRATVAALSRSRSADDPELLAARRRLKTERLAQQITSVVDTAPALSDEQRARLAALLRPATASGGDLHAAS